MLNEDSLLKYPLFLTTTLLINELFIYLLKTKQNIYIFIVARQRWKMKEEYHSPQLLPVAHLCYSNIFNGIVNHPSCRHAPNPFFYVVAIHVF
jgi:hypothetical protein